MHRPKPPMIECKRTAELDFEDESTLRTRNATFTDRKNGGRCPSGHGLSLSHRGSIGLSHPQPKHVKIRSHP